MASDASFTQTIFFIASIVVAVSIAGTIIAVSGMMADEVRTKAGAAASEMGSSIVIINDPRQVPYDDGQLTIYIKNVGSTVPSHRDMLIFLDGEFIEYDARLLDDSRDTWSIGSVVEATITANMQAGDHTVKIVLTNGISDTLDFRI